MVVPRLSAFPDGSLGSGSGILFRDFAIDGISSGTSFVGAVLSFTDGALVVLGSDRLTVGEGRTYDLYFDGMLVAQQTSRDDRFTTFVFTAAASETIVEYVADHVAVASNLPFQGVYRLDVAFHLQGASDAETAGLTYNATGSSGNSRSAGLTDTDVFSGGNGSDTILITGSINRFADDRIDTFDGGQGTDTITIEADPRAASNLYTIDLSAAGVSQYLNTVLGTVRLISIENFIDRTGNAPNVYGTDGRNTIVAGAGSLYGRGGDDFLSGRGLVDGGDGNDTLISLGTSTIDLNLTSSQNGLRVISIENVVGTAIDETFVGTAGSNRLDGGGGKDRLSGGDGDDTLIGDPLSGGFDNDYLDGGAGNDLLTSAGGTDVVIGGTGTDTLDLTHFHGALTIDLGTEAAQPYIVIGRRTYYLTVSEVENLAGGDDHNRLSGNHHANVLTGNVLSDSLSGKAGDDVLDGRDGNDTLNGGAGADTMIGGSGNDTFYVDNPGDTIVELADGFYASADRVITEIDYALSDTVENLDVRATVAVGLALGGNAFHNRIRGGAGDDVVSGGGGADDLRGGAGADVFRYDAVTDSPAGAATRDTIRDFAQGQDHIDLSVLARDTGLSFIGKANFDGAAGQIRYFQSGSATVIEVDADGDRSADFQVKLVGVFDLATDDLTLGSAPTFALAHLSTEGFAV